MTDNMSEPNNKEKKPRKKKKKATKKWPIISACIILIVVIAGIWVWSLVGAKAPVTEPTRIYIPEGSGNEAIGDTLRTSLGDNFGTKVARLWAWQNGSAAQAVGSYVIHPGDMALMVSRMLLYNRQSPVKVTYNNIRTFDQLAARIGKQMMFTPEQFKAACDSILSGTGYTRENFTAAFLPDTYEFYWNADPAYVVEKLVSHRDKFWNSERLEKAAALGLTPEEVTTLASIVEEETNKKDERPLVARLYLNRLQKGMKLQADPTVKFAIGDFSLRRILNTHLRKDSPYNTYRNVGLPPGPIRIPNAETIDAVLDAPEHDYIYMCAKETFNGYHNFASNYKDHQANAKRYQQALNKRGIRRIIDFFW